MGLLRLFLFLGLVFHKIIWELLKRRNKDSGTQKQTAKRPFIIFFKSFKILVLTFLIIQTLFLDLFPINDQSFQVRILGFTLYLIGLTTAVLGRVQLGENWLDIESIHVLPEQSLVNYGIYRFIRHPIYIGDTLLLTGLELALNSWLVLGVLFIIPIIVRQALVEESLLSQKFPDYKSYSVRTKRFVPFIF